MWNPYSIAGLTSVNYGTYGHRRNQIALAGSGGLSESATGVFSYDDTGWGTVPDGILKTISTCAVMPTSAVDPWFSGQYVQLQIAFVNQMGRDYTVITPGTTPGINGGTVSDFHVSMVGFSTVSAAHEDDGSAFTGITGLIAPYVYLVRPVPLAWPGQDVTNEANKTVWLQSEVGAVTFGFSVTSNSFEEEIQFYAYGWSAS